MQIIRHRLLHRAALAGLLGALAAFSCTPLHEPDNVRILTYNAAFLYLEARSSLPPPPVLPCATSCDPVELPPFPIPCYCHPSLTMWPNDGIFEGLGDVERAQKIAQRIVATDQDVVVLNEVFNPQTRQALVQLLATLGPYPHYVSLLRGELARPIWSTLGDLADEGAGPLGGAVVDVLASLPVLPYEPVPADSGLMIFSKYPFLPLTGPSVPNDALCGAPECAFAGRNKGGPILPGYFAFEVYPDCENADCMASKGVGLVKIDTPRQPSYVAFTHMQADYPQSGLFFEHVRAGQLETVRDVIVKSIPVVEQPGARVFLAGDLNIEGAPRTSSETPSTREWHEAFHPNASQGNAAGEFFACGGQGVLVGGNVQPCRFGQNGTRMLTESWGFETSTTDRGITNESGDVRLDYLLHSDARMCMQHAMIAWDVHMDPATGYAAQLSDHLSVRGDFGLSAAWCSPSDDPAAARPQHNTRLLVFGPTNCVEGGNATNPPCKQDEIVGPPQAQIGPAGAMQWFLIDQPGSYSIRLTPAASDERVAYAVYHHTDLSRPIPPWDEEEGELGIPYAMPDPPYYIRTFATGDAGKPDRLAKGRSYTLAVHQHLCRDPADPCLLTPGRVFEEDGPYAYVWPTTTDLLSDVRELWWKFKTSGVRDGRLRPGKEQDIGLPTVRMQIEAGNLETYGCVTAVPPVVERYDDHVFPGTLEETIDFVDTQICEFPSDPQFDHDCDVDGFQDDRRLAPGLPGFADDELAVYFLKLTRDSNWQDGFNPCNFGMTSWVAYLTDLTYLAPTRLQSFTHDFPWTGGLRVRMGFDDAGFTPDPPPPSYLTVAAPGVTHSLPPWLGGYYVDRLWPNLWADFVSGAALLSPWSSTFDGLPPMSGLLPPSPDADFTLFADGPNGDEASYYHYLWAEKCYIEQEPPCAEP